MPPVFRIVVPRKPYPFAPQHVERDQPQGVGPKTDHCDFKETKVPSPVEEKPYGEHAGETSPMNGRYQSVVAVALHYFRRLVEVYAMRLQCVKVNKFQGFKVCRCQLYTGGFASLTGFLPTERT